MPELLEELFSYSFVNRAIIVGIFVSLCASFLGLPLVLRRYSMIGDGLSHVGFGTLAIAIPLGVSPLKVSIPLVMLAAFLLLRIRESSKMRGDAAIAIISCSSLAIGVIVMSVFSGMNTDIYNYMFGSILAIKQEEVYLCVAISVVIFALFVFFYNKLFFVIFDESYARASGTSIEFYNMLLALLTAVIIVIGMRIMGAMLISSLIIFPALTSMRLLKTFKSVIICSCILSVVCFMLGIVVSFACNFPTGPSIVMANLCAFLIFSLISLTSSS
ncbi:MAG: metal ABC transporter permease [Fibromonadales bacterium]|nr:metal ABC transporter permease [Fibromonadales bacterium]